MGEHDETGGGLLPNGLLPNEAGSVMQVLGDGDSDRWLKAEERTAKLITCIQPNPPSEGRRNAVADYVIRLIRKCFPCDCEVFTFGSVPLKTYLPDGDIDLTAFSKKPNMKESWAHQVRDMLENEEKNENAEFHVKEVQYIQAEVKIIKCLVENIVVDISFNQLGGLCTLCFLGEVDNLINQNHLFKRSIILIKAWCYYESRILGAHHGLISTYALETLVLYIFHVFNNSFAGPLEVLYRFLEFFSKFDWDNFCVSLWGPVPISSLPDVTAESPRKDGGELLLSKSLDACSTRYAVRPVGQENQGQPFVSKHFNVIDPLRINNNLGRSVSKGNFFRIRSAFAFGAKRLARLLDCPKEDLFFEVDQFFLNTWDRHGSGHRPDAPRNDLRLSALDKVQRISKPDNLVNDIQGKFLFARTRSSPELTETYGEVSSQGRRNRGLESGKSQTSASFDNSRRKNQESDILASHSIRTEDPASVRHILSRQSLDAAADSNCGSNSYHEETGSGSMGEEFASVMGAQGMHQEEQDLVNMMASSATHNFNGQVHLPLNLVSGHFPIPSSVLASMEYAQRNLSGMVPTNFPLIETPWGINMQLPQGFSSTIAHYFPGMGLTSNPEDSIEPVNENFGSVEMSLGESDNDFWHEQDRGSTGGFDLDNGSFEMLQSDDKLQSTSAGHKFDPSFRIVGSSSATRNQQKITKENQGSMRDDRVDALQYQDNRGNEVYHDDRTSSLRSLPSATPSSVKSKTSSESSFEGSSVKVSKSTWEKRGRRTAASVPPSTIVVKGKSTSEHSSTQGDDDNRDWNLLSTMGSELAERSTGAQSVAALHVTRHQVPGFESAQTSGSESLIPIAPMLLGPGSRQRNPDGSGVPTFFYPTGPPVPFVAMFPVYNFPTEAGTSDTSMSQFSGEEGLDNSDSSQNFDSSEGLDLHEVLSTNSVRSTVPNELLEHKSDILKSDFPIHLQNLRYGRLCQNSGYYPSPVMVPPVYLHGRIPSDGPGRPLSNVNLFTQLMSYGPRFVPVAPLQSVSNRPAAVLPRYGDEIPRYRSGTGTYLPNPKLTARDRQSTGARRGNYGYDRSDHHGGREGNWNINPKSRAAGRSHSRTQAEKPNSRSDRLAASESRTDRPWGSHRRGSFPSHQSQNGPVHSNSVQSSPSNVTYGMYPLPTMNPSGVALNGPTIPPLVMVYPYDHNAGYGSHAEQLEFGSLGPMGLSGVNEVSQLNDGSQLSGAFEIHGVSAQRSSPDQPSSPHLRRGHSN